MKASFYDPERPVESFKEMLRGLLAGYKFDVKGLYLLDGSVEPLPAEPAVVGKVTATVPGLKFPKILVRGALSGV